MDQSEAEQRYAIRGGHEGKKRLDLLARVMLPTTMQLLDRVGLIKGMKYLDAGCGGGHVATLMARIVSSSVSVPVTRPSGPTRWQEKTPRLRTQATLSFNTWMLARLCGGRNSI